MNFQKGIMDVTTERRQGSREARTVPAGDSGIAHGMKLIIHQQDLEIARLRDALQFIADYSPNDVPLVLLAVARGALAGDEYGLEITGL
jgi:hypothetical protein